MDIENEWSPGCHGFNEIGFDFLVKTAEVFVGISEKNTILPPILTHIKSLSMLVAKPL